MFSGCSLVRPILVNTISQECLEGVPLNLAQVSTWTQGLTNRMFKGLRDLTKHFHDHNSRIPKPITILQKCLIG